MPYMLMPENISNPGHNSFAYNVSEIAFALKKLVEDNFGQVRVRGEISGWKGAHSSGHAYFRLKDDKAVLEAVCWRGTLGKIPFKMEEGLEVIASGRITTYPGSSKYQIVIDSIEPAGVGALMALLEKRKVMLAAEGLFDEKRKKSLPFMPQVIGVITSPTGAVIRDILHRLSDRFPCHVMVWPVAVQGEGAAEQVAAAIEGFNNLDGSSPPRPNLLIVARGGGSLEDLWAFNEEVVVRAAAASRIPLISAVGHETDTTLIDFASDRRAPTPTAAAEMAVPVRQDWLLTTLQYYEQLMRAILRGLQMRQEMLLGLARGLLHPRRLLETATQLFDERCERLQNAGKAIVAERLQQLTILTATLQPRNLASNIEHHNKNVIDLGTRMRRLIVRILSDSEQRMENIFKLIESLSPLRVLKRGFAMVKNSRGTIITSAKLMTDATHTVIFHDGERKVQSLG